MKIFFFFCVQYIFSLQFSGQGFWVKHVSTLWVSTCFFFIPRSCGLDISGSYQLSLLKKNTHWNKNALHIVCCVCCWFGIDIGGWICVVTQPFRRIASVLPNSGAVFSFRGVAEISGVRLHFVLQRCLVICYECLIYSALHAFMVISFKVHIAFKFPSTDLNVNGCRFLLTQFKQYTWIFSAYKMISKLYAVKMC